MGSTGELTTRGVKTTWSHWVSVDEARLDLLERRQLTSLFRLDDDCDALAAEEAVNLVTDLHFELLISENKYKKLCLLPRV